jgi:hypothetical protein
MHGIFVWTIRDIIMSLHQCLLILLAKSSQIENQLQQGVSTRQIMRGLHQTGESSLKAQDIYNLRKDLRNKFLEGKTPIQALISQLPENGDWIFNCETGQDHVIHTFFCTHRTSLDNLRLNPYVLFMDCTYKTNQYRMPHCCIDGLQQHVLCWFCV